MDVECPVSQICSICELDIEQDDEKVNVSTNKGRSSLKEVSKLRGDGKFSSLDIEKSSEIILHTVCRRAYIRCHTLRKDQEESGKSVKTPTVAARVRKENGQVSNSLRQLDSSHGATQFDYLNLCIYCGGDASETFMWKQLRLQQKNLKANLVRFINKTNNKEVLHQAIVWGEEVLERVVDIDLANLLSMKVRFHIDCFTLHSEAIRDRSQGHTKYMNKIINKLEKEIEDGNIEELTKAIALKKKVYSKDFNYERHCIICATDTCDASGGPTLQVHRLTAAATLMKLLNCVSNEEMRSRVTNVVVSDQTARCHKVCYLRFYETCRDAMEKARRAQAGLEYYSDYIVDDVRDKEFDYRAHCLVCGRDAASSECGDASAASDVRLVQTQHTGRVLLDVSLRFHDMWREQVRRRVQEKDLVALGARYHKGCFPHLFIPPPDLEARAMETQLLEENVYNDMFREIPGDDIAKTEDSNHKVKTFDGSLHCVFCGEDASPGLDRGKYARRKRVCILQDQGVTSLLKNLKQDHPNSHLIQKRIEGYSHEELVALRLKYHRYCLLRFTDHKTRVKLGRPVKDNILGWQDWSEIDNTTIDHHSDIDSSDKRQDSSVISQDNSVINQDSTVISQDSSVINQDSSVINQDSSVISQDSSVIRQDSNVISQDSSVINQDSSVINEDCNDCNDEHDDFEDEDDYQHLSFQESSLVPQQSKTTRTELSSELNEVVVNGAIDCVAGVGDASNSSQKFNLDDDDHTLKKSEALGKNLKRENAWCKVVCNVCLSRGRTLRALGPYAHIFNIICANVNRKQTYACWECFGILRKIEEFRARAERAQLVLTNAQGFEETKPSSLSTMTMILLEKTSHDGHSQTGYEGQIYIEIQNEDTNINTDANKSDDENEQDAETNEYLDVETMDYDITYDKDDASNKKDVNVDNKSETRDDSNQKIDNREKNENKNSDLTKRKRSAARDAPIVDDLKIDNCEKKENKNCDLTKRKRSARQAHTDDSINKTSSKTEKHTLKRIQMDTSDDEDDLSDTNTDIVDAEKNRDADSDYEPPKKKKTYEGSERQKNYIRHVGGLTEVVRRVQIKSREAPFWMDRERNSEYFKKMKKKKCLLCVTPLEHETWERHIEERHTETLTSHTCSICKIVFDSLGKLEEHMKFHYFGFECTICGYKCYTKRNICNHHLTQHRSWIQCVECDAKFCGMADFTNHWQEVHKTFDCQLCDTRLPTKERLDRHVERNHTPHTCVPCGKTYMQYRLYKSHMEFKHKIERGEDAFCVPCGVQFDNRAQYQQHLAKTSAHAAERADQPFACSKCDQVFPTPAKLHYHKQMVHNQDKFICQQCGKMYAIKGKLKEHITRVHEGVPAPRNKICPQCGRGFKTRKVLVHHIRTHTGERPFACPLDYCGAAFAQKTAMKMHVKKVHKGQGLAA